MGTFITVVLLAAVAAVAVFGARHLLRVALGKDSCCGGSSAGGTTRPRRKPRRAGSQKADPDQTHYAHTSQIVVRGMTCERCARRVEQYLGALPGTLATVDLSSRTATVLTKEEPDLGALERAIEDAGYSVIHL